MYLVCKDNKKFEESGELITAAKALGMTVSEKPLKSYLPTNDKNDQDSFFLYGVRDFVLPLVNHNDHIFSKQEYIYDYSFLSSSGLNAYLFNPYPVYCTAGEVYRQPMPDYHYFIRPVSGNKQFTGQVLSRETLKNDIVDLFQISPWEMVVLHTQQEKPAEEYRFFVLKKDDRISMMGCRYLPDETSVFDRQIVYYAENIATKLFEKIPFGNSFVLDIAVDKYGYKSILEINSWNSSSLYSICPKKMLEMIISRK